jgi:hypothetical protein
MGWDDPNSDPMQDMRDVLQANFDRGLTPTLLDITQKDLDGLTKIEQAINTMPSDMIAHIKCFNKKEAQWIRRELLRKGIHQSKFYLTWLVFKPKV